MNASEKKAEEMKRERAFDPVQQWKAIQDMITWVESNVPYDQRRNRPRTRKPPDLTES